MTTQQRVHRKLFILLLAFGAVGIFSTGCNKDKSVKQEMQEVGNDIERGTSKAIREIKDESCELINGKMQCAGQKAKHSVQDSTNKVEDAID